MRKGNTATTVYLLLFGSLCGTAQKVIFPSIPPSLAYLPAQNTAQTAQSKEGDELLTRQQAEQLALKNNPQISVAALIALAQKQVVRETRSGELPSLYGNGTAVGAEEASRLSSGTLSA